MEKAGTLRTCPLSSMVLPNQNLLRSDGLYSSAVRHPFIPMYPPPWSQLALIWTNRPTVQLPMDNLQLWKITPIYLLKQRMTTTMDWRQPNNQQA